MKITFQKITAVALSIIMAMPVLLAYPHCALASDDDDEYLKNHLVAQYFTDSNLTEDKIGNSNLEAVGSNAVWFTEGVGGAAKFPGGATGSKTNYYRVKTENMLSNVTPVGGLTVSFYAKRETEGWNRYFEFSSNSGYSNGNSSSYMYFSTNSNSKIKNQSYGNSETSSPSINDNGGWHRWTITVNKSTLFVYKDGVYNGMIEDTQRITESFFSNIKNGYLLLGGSSYDSDPLFDGYISDFKVYDVALTSLQVRFEANGKPSNHSDVNVRFETGINFHGTAGGSGYGMDGDSYYYSPQNSAYGLTRYSSAQLLYNDDSLKYFSMWNNKDKLVYSDSANPDEGIFQPERDFRFDVTLGARNDSASEYLIGVYDKSGNIPIKLLRNGNISVNGVEIESVNAVYSGEVEKYYNNYTFSFDYSSQRLHFSCYGEYTDGSHNFAIEKDINLADYAFNLDPGELSGINILDGSGDGHARFGGIYFYTPYFDVEPTLEGLKAAVAAYESKMKSTNIYSNNIQAYDAYVTANKYIDAAEYGNRVFTSSEYQSVSHALTDATNKLKEWSPVRASYHARFSEDNDFVSESDYAKTYVNVLWANDVSKDVGDAAVLGDEVSIYGNSEKCNARLYHPSAVLLYDGKNIPAIPVMSYFRHWTSSVHTYNINYSAMFLNSNTSELEINDKWRNGSGGSVNESFNYQWHYLNNNGNEVNIANYDTFDISQHWGKYFTSSMEFHFGFANQIRFIGVLGENEGSRTLDNVNWGFNFYNQISDRKTERLNSTKPIYVINYKTLIDAVNACALKTANIESFKEGGMRDFLAALDEATAFNPQTAFDYSTETANKVNQCAERISELCGTLKAENYAVADSYPLLRYEMKENNVSPTGNTAQTDYNTPNSELNLSFTASSVSAFKKAYRDAVREMYFVVENGYYEAPESYTSLRDTHSQLEALADFSALDSAKEKALQDAMNIDESLYTPSSVSQLNEYLTSYFEFPYEYIGDRTNTGVSKQAEIDAEALKFANAQNNVLIKRSSMFYFDNAYAQCVEFLENMTAAPQYYASDVNALIEKLESEEVQKYASQTADDREEYAENGEQEREANEIADSLLADIQSMKNAENIVDISAYQQAVFVALDADNDAYNYPKEELNRDLRVATSSITTTIEYNGLSLKAIKNDAKQTVVNAVTSLIQSSLTSHIRTYSVEIVEGSVSSADGVTFNGGTHSYDGTNDIYYATYNTKLNLKADSVSAWYMEFESPSVSRSVQYQGSGKRYSTKVIGNIKVYVYNSEGKKKVTVARKYSDNDNHPHMLETYVESSYTLPEAPAIAFYTFSGYTVGNKVYNPGDTVEITEDTFIYADYTLDKALSCAVNIDGESGFSAEYNERINLSGDEDTYAWLELNKSNNIFKPFFIGKDVSFLVTESITLKKVNENEFTAGKYKLPSINVRQDGANISETDGVKKVTFNAQYVSDGAYEIAEYGILIGKAADGGSIKPFDVILDNIATSDEYILTRFKSTKNVGANQFTIGIRNLSGDVIYKGYLTYKLANGEFATVYSDAMIESL